jgi:hypothetical protein
MHLRDDAPRGQDHWHLTPDEQRLVEAKRRASLSCAALFMPKVSC